MEKLKPLLPYLLLLLPAGIAIWYFYPRAHPFGSTQLHHNVNGIIDCTQAILREVGVCASW